LTGTFDLWRAVWINNLESKIFVFSHPTSYAHHQHTRRSFQHLPLVYHGREPRESSHRKTSTTFKPNNPVAAKEKKSRIGINERSYGQHT
jgi:hypothetical protein